MDAKKILLAFFAIIIVLFGIVLVVNNEGQVTTDNFQVNNEQSQESMNDSADVKEFTVEGSALKFSPNKLSVNKGDFVRITFKNSGGTHDFRIDELGVATKIISGGQQDVVEFTATEAGSFEFYCSVMDHKQKGMVGVLEVK